MAAKSKPEPNRKPNLKRDGTHGKRKEKEVRELWINPNAIEMGESQMDMCAFDCECQLPRNQNVQQELQRLARVYSQIETAVEDEDEDSDEEPKSQGFLCFKPKKSQSKLSKSQQKEKAKKEQHKREKSSYDRSKEKEEAAKKDSERKNRSRQPVQICKFQTREEVKRFKELKSIYSTKPKRRSSTTDNQQKKLKKPDKRLDHEPSKRPRSSSDDSVHNPKHKQHTSRKERARRVQQTQSCASNNSDYPQRRSYSRLSEEEKQRHKKKSEKSGVGCCGSRKKSHVDKQRREYEAYKPTNQQTSNHQAASARTSTLSICPLTRDEIELLETLKATYAREVNKRETENRADPLTTEDTGCCSKSKKKRQSDDDSYYSLHSQYAIDPNEPYGCRCPKNYSLTFEQKYPTREYPSTIFSHDQASSEREEKYRMYTPRKMKSAEENVIRKTEPKNGKGKSDSSICTCDRNRKYSKEPKHETLPEDSDSEKPAICSCFNTPKSKSKRDKRPSQVEEKSQTRKPTPLMGDAETSKRKNSDKSKKGDESKKPDKKAHKQSSTTSCCPISKQNKSKKEGDTKEKPTKTEKEEVVRKKSSDTSYCAVGKKDKPKKEADNKEKPTKTERDEKTHKKSSDTSCCPRSKKDKPKKQADMKEKSTKTEKDEKFHKKSSDTSCCPRSKKDKPKKEDGMKGKPRKSKSEEKVHKKSSDTSCFPRSKKDKPKKEADMKEKSTKTEKDEKIHKKSSDTSCCPRSKTEEPKKEADIKEKPTKTDRDEKLHKKSSNMSCCPRSKKYKPKKEDGMKEKPPMNRSQEKVKPQEKDDSKRKRSKIKREDPQKKSSQTTYFGSSKKDQSKKLDGSERKISKSKSREKAEKISPKTTCTCCGGGEKEKPNINTSDKKTPKSTTPTKGRLINREQKMQTNPKPTRVASKKSSQTYFCPCCELSDERVKSPTRAHDKRAKPNMPASKKKHSDSSFCSCCTSADTRQKSKDKQIELSQQKGKDNTKEKEWQQAEYAQEMKPPNFSYCDALYNELENLVMQKEQCPKQKPPSSTSKESEKRDNGYCRDYCGGNSSKNKETKSKSSAKSKSKEKHQTHSNIKEAEPRFSEAKNKYQNWQRKAQEVYRYMSKDNAHHKGKTKTQNGTTILSEPPPLAPCYATSDSKIQKSYVAEYVLGKKYQRSRSLAQVRRVKYDVILGSSAKKKCYKNPDQAPNSSYFYGYGVDCKN